MTEHEVDGPDSHRGISSEAWADEYDVDVSAGVPATRGLRAAAELPPCEYFDLFAIQKAHYLANKEALLEHARMGRSVCEGRDGKIVDVTPAEIFARYGLNEVGRPKAATDSTG